jgi:pheromone receptor transcription factor
MADITDHNDPASPSALDDHSVGNGTATGESRGIKRQRPATADDDDDDDDKPGRERRKIEIKFITDKSRRHITFSKRKAGIMKKVRLPLPPTTALDGASCPRRVVTGSNLLIAFLK